MKRYGGSGFGNLWSVENEDSERLNAAVTQATKPVHVATGTGTGRGPDTRGSPVKIPTQAMRSFKFGAWGLAEGSVACDDPAMACRATACGSPQRVGAGYPSDKQ